MNTNEFHPFTRRDFCRTLALPTGALVLGSGEPAWAKTKKQPAAPVSPSGSDSGKTKCETKVLWDFSGCIEDRTKSSVLLAMDGVFTCRSAGCWLVIGTTPTLNVLSTLSASTSTPSQTAR